MEVKLNKVKQHFNKIKDIRIAVVNIFNTLEVKITKLKGLTNDFIKNNQNAFFVFGLDSFMFQSKMIDFEYTDMQKYFMALNNRMYCEYYKLYKLVSEYIEQNVGIAQNKTFEMIKANSKFPIYKDLEPYKQYSFETIEEVHKTIIALLNVINDYIVLKDAELDAFKMKQYSGFNINNFVNTFDYNIIMVKQKLILFVSYLEFFHNIHTKHFKRFSKKMKLMDDYINEDIQFDDSPRHKMSKDFDDSSSEGSSNGGGTDNGKTSVPEPHHKPAQRKSFLKKSVDSAINVFKAFSQKPAKPTQTSTVDLTNNSNNNNNINLTISETNSEDLSDKDINTELNEVNIASISRERSATISEQLNKDPKLVSKMFDELTKTFDDEESVSKKIVRKASKSSLQVTEETVAVTIKEETVSEETTIVAIKEENLEEDLEGTSSVASLEVASLEEEAIAVESSVASLEEEAIVVSEEAKARMDNKASNKKKKGKKK